MRRSLSLPLAAGAFLVLATTLTSGTSAQSARAAEGCGLQALHGGYGFTFKGQVIPPNAAGLDNAGDGRIVFDGHGGFSGKEKASTNGVQESITFTGTYGVQPDCTGAATVVNSNGRTDHINLGLIEGGQEFNFMATDPGVVLTGQASRAVSRCTNRSLRGTFSFAESGGAYADGGAEYADWSLTGTIHFDGNGKEFGSITASFDGSPLSDTFVGTYQVNPDCTGSTTGNFTGGSSDHLFIVLVEQGNEVKFVSTDPGIVMAGNFDRMASGDESGQN